MINQRPVWLLWSILINPTLDSHVLNHSHLIFIFKPKIYFFFFSILPCPSASLGWSQPLPWEEKRERGRKLGFRNRTRGIKYKLLYKKWIKGTTVMTPLDTLGLGHMSILGHVSKSFRVQWKSSLVRNLVLFYNDYWVMTIWIDVLTFFLVLAAHWMRILLYLIYHLVMYYLIC